MAFIANIALCLPSLSSLKTWFRYIQLPFAQESPAKTKKNVKNGEIFYVVLLKISKFVYSPDFALLFVFVIFCVLYFCFFSSFLE